MLPSLPLPVLSARAAAALSQAVELASVPATARLAVPDAVLAGFAPPRVAASDALNNPWAPGAALPARPAATDARLRAIAAATGVASAAAAPPTVQQPAPPSGPQFHAQSARDSLGAAAAALLADGQAGAASALDQARMAASRLRPATASAPPSASFATADAVLARLQEAAAPGALRDSLRDTRQGLAGLAGNTQAAAVAAPIAALASRRAALPAPSLKPAAPIVPARRIPVLPAVPTRTETAATIPADSWGIRAPTTAPPPAATPATSRAAPYDTLTAGALSGIGAASVLMRRNGFGGLRDPGALDRLAAAIEEDGAESVPPDDPQDFQRLMQWCGLARQACLLRTRFGLLPWDPGKQPALAEALARRASWLSERSVWPGRAEAAAGLEQWLPLVECAEALDLPLQGEHALRNLGRAIRHTAGITLPRPHDMAGLGRSLASQDALATLHEATGLDPASEAGAVRLMAIARGLETLPDLPACETVGVVDTTTLARLHHLDRSQAGELGLHDLTGREIPLLSRGLPVLAARDARRRYRTLALPITAP